MLTLGEKVATADHLIRLRWQRSGCPSPNALGGAASCAAVIHSASWPVCGPNSWLASFPAASLCRAGSEHQHQILGGLFGAGICETAAGPCRDVTGGSAGAQWLNSALFASLPQGDPKSIISHSARPPRTARREPIAQFLPVISLWGRK